MAGISEHWVQYVKRFSYVTRLSKRRWFLTFWTFSARIYPCAHFTRSTSPIKIPEKCVNERAPRPFSRICIGDPARTTPSLKIPKKASTEVRFALAREFVLVWGPCAIQRTENTKLKGAILDTPVEFVLGFCAILRKCHKERVILALSLEFVLEILRHPPLAKNPQPENIRKGGRNTPSIDFSLESLRDPLFP